MNSAVRDEAVDLYLRGWSVPDIANYCNVSVPTIHKWIPKNLKRRAHVPAGRTGEYVKGDDLARVMQESMDTSDYRFQQHAAAGTQGGQANLGHYRTGGRWNTSIVAERHDVPVAKMNPFAKMSEVVGMHQTTLERYYKSGRTEWVEFENADKVMTYLGAHWRFNVDVPIYVFHAGQQVRCI